MTTAIFAIIPSHMHRLSIHSTPSMLCLELYYCAIKTIGGFHVTSYQANFASHCTRNCHVGFLLACDGIGKNTKCSITFYLVPTTLPNYNQMTILSAHTHTHSDEIFSMSKSKVQAFLLFFFIHVPHCAKGNPSDVAKS